VALIHYAAVVSKYNARIRYHGTSQSKNNLNRTVCLVLAEYSIFDIFGVVALWSVYVVLLLYTIYNK